MLVHIIGPNLRDQSKGDFHVHAKGCEDVRRNRDYAGPDFEHDRQFPVEVASRIMLSNYVYSDQISEGSMTAEDGVPTMWFAPCTDDLPLHEPVYYYEMVQLQRVLDAGPDKGEDFFRLQVTGEVASKHLNITAEQLTKIIALFA